MATKRKIDIRPEMKEVFIEPLDAHNHDTKSQPTGNWEVFIVSGNVIAVTPNEFVAKSVRDIIKNNRVEWNHLLEKYQ